jgi:hypothetical protein
MATNEANTHPVPAQDLEVWSRMYTGHVIEDLIKLAEVVAKRDTRQEPPKPKSAPVLDEESKRE